MVHHLTEVSQQYAAFLLQQKPDVKVLPLQHHYEPGALVWLREPQQSSLAGSKKFCNLWTGLFLILDTLTNRTVNLLKPSIQSPRHTVKVSVDRLRPYLTPIYQPWMTGEQPFKFPLYILARKLSNDKFYYKVQWLSKDPIPDTWERADRLPLQLVFNYDQLLRQKDKLPLQPQDHLFPAGE